jgi:enoyl-CoA hydratase/carnithine racemase
MIEERRDGDVTWLTFDRRDRLNAFTVEGYRNLRIALERLAADDRTRVVVLTGRGRAFSAGADLSLLDRGSTEIDKQRAGEVFRRFLDVLGGFEKPLFAAVNGLAVGIGCTMLLYCDVVLVAETARLRLPFTALGIVPEAGSSMLLPARVRWADAMWAMLSSEWIDATAARQMGLASRVVPDDDLLEEVASAAASVAACEPQSVVATKRLMTAGRLDAARLAITREMAEMKALASGKPR